MNPLTALLPFVCPRDPGRRFLRADGCTAAGRQARESALARQIKERGHGERLLDLAVCIGCKGPVRVLEATA